MSEELTNLNVRHILTESWSKEDTEDQIDISVDQNTGRLPVHFQLTFRRRAPWKIRRFVKATLRSSILGPRVYLKVKASPKELRHKGQDYVTRRVASAIKYIADNFRDFGKYMIIGLSYTVGRSSKDKRFERFSLDAIVEELLPQIIEEFREAAAEAVKTGRRKMQRFTWPQKRSKSRRSRLVSAMKKRTFIPHDPPPRRAFARLRLP